MTSCENCGTSISAELTRGCSKCGLTVCTSCTLPENHNCIALKLEAVGVGSLDGSSREKDPDRRRSTGHETVDPTVYSSAPEPDYDKSPDVAVDGSIKPRGGEKSRVSDSYHPETYNQSSRNGLFIAGILLLFCFFILALEIGVI